MLTTKIPESTSQKSAEDKVADYAIKSIERKGVAVVRFYSKGNAAGTFWNGDNYEFVGLEAINTVANTFKGAGYIVQTKNYSDNSSSLWIK